LLYPLSLHDALPIYFDVARLADELFDIKLATAESSLCFRAAAFISLGEFCQIAHGAHPASAATRKCLQHDSAIRAEAFHEGARLDRKSTRLNSSHVK